LRVDDRWYFSCCTDDGMRVLIVEDDRSVGSVLQDFLLELGMNQSWYSPRKARSTASIRTAPT